MADYEYKTWKFKTQQASEWSAVMWPPGSGLADPKIITVEKSEGEQILIKRVQAYIDSK